MDPDRETASGSSPADPPRLRGKVIGFRGWTLDGYKLVSANNRQHGMHWKIGPNRAVCKIDERIRFLGADPRTARPPQHDAPHPDCECGLYAYFEPQRERNPHRFSPDALIWGAVAAWGRIEVHHGGFRAEYAEPVVLAYHPRQPYEDVVTAQAIAEEWRVPFVTLDELPGEAAKHGQQIPEEMRPAAIYCPAELVQHWLTGCAFTGVWQTMTEPAKVPSSEEFERHIEWIRTHAHGFRPKTGTTPQAPKRANGIAEHRATAGPPRAGWHQKGMLTSDATGARWRCTKTGTPGRWERVEP